MPDDLPSIEKALSRLKRVGLSLATEGFGMGYSSLPALSSRSAPTRRPRASTPERADA